MSKKMESLVSAAALAENTAMSFDPAVRDIVAGIKANCFEGAEAAYNNHAQKHSKNKIELCM